MLQLQLTATVKHRTLDQLINRENCNEQQSTKTKMKDI